MRSAQLHASALALAHVSAYAMPASPVANGTITITESHMKTGRTLSELATELDRQTKSKKDFLADTRAMRLEPTEDGNIILQGVNGGMPLRSTAHQQLASTLGIPKPYYDRMLTDAPDLLATNANRWLQSPARKLVRTLDGQVRAILSDSYRPLDNFDLAEAVLPSLFGLQAQVMSGEVTENRFYLKAVTDRVQGEVKRGDIVQAGLVISNSEVGQGSLRVEALDFRLVCTNGMIREQAIRKAHLGRNSGRMDAIEDAREFFKDETRTADDKAFFLKVRDTVGGMFDAGKFNARLLQYQDATNKPIEADPVKAIEVTAKRFGMSQDEQGGILSHLIRGGDLSAWGLANAITRLAEDQKDYDRATELETLGGKVIDMADTSEWKQIATSA